MIWSLLAAAAASVAPIPSQSGAQELLAGAEHAIRVNRLEQAKLMVSRAVAAGASGRKLDQALADYAYASGNYREALARYEAMLKSAPGDKSPLEPAGLAALKLGNVQRASVLLSQATAGGTGGWRAWNALGVVADLRSDWTTADECYAEASKRAPNEVEPVNNQGWSLLLRGNWGQAVKLFEQAVELDPKSARAANNLELAKAALSAELPRREVGETDSAWAARLNDAGVAAAILGNKERATAAFTQALDASGIWYERAANNLAALGSR